MPVRAKHSATALPVFPWTLDAAVIQAEIPLHAGVIGEASTMRGMLPCPVLQRTVHRIIEVQKIGVRSKKRG